MLTECDRKTKLIDFCQEDPVRRRSLMHDLNPPSPELDSAVRAYYGDTTRSNTYFVDDPDDITLIVRKNVGLNATGSLLNVDPAEFSAWCKSQSPWNLHTNDEEIHRALTGEFDERNWIRNGLYTTTPASFIANVSHEVRKLSIADTPLWRRFVEAHAEDSMMSRKQGGSGAAVRDFELMCEGFAVDCYATFSKGNISGVLSVSPFTDKCDEILMAFVSPAYRREGQASSLLSVATRDILNRGRQPTYSAASNRVDIVSFLNKQGYQFISYDWYFWL